LYEDKIQKYRTEIEQCMRNIETLKGAIEKETQNALIKTGKIQQLEELAKEQEAQKETDTQG
jgi:hypothetical protein